MTTNAGDKVKFWRNKRPLTLRDYQEGVVVALGPTEIKPAEGEEGLTVSLGKGEFWLSVKNAANGKEFRVVAKESDSPAPGCFTNEKPKEKAASAAPAPVAASASSGRSSATSSK